VDPPRDGGKPLSEPGRDSDVGSNVPTGTDVHAFLIADVRGYTSFTQERGDEDAGRLAARFSLVARAVVEEHRGEVLELRGDEALCVFASPRSAIRAAVALQNRFVDETISDPSLPLTIGIGLDAGEAVPVDGGYRGGALNVAARLCSLARAGEVLASREIVHLARRVEGVRFTERGPVQLKGLDQPVHVVAVRSESEDTAVAIAPFVRSGPAPSQRRAPWKLVAIVAAILVVAAVIAVPTFVRKAGAGTEIEPNSVGVVDLSTAELTDTIAMPSRPGAITAGDGSLWVTNPDAETVTRIDEGSQAVVDTIPVGGAPAGIVAGFDAVWVVESGGPSVSRISPGTNEVVGDPIGVGNGPAAVAVGEGSVWVTNRLDGTISRIDPDRGAVVREISVGLDPSGIAVGFGSVWVPLAGSNTVVRVDPQTNAVTHSIDVGNAPGSLVVSPDAVWVANSLADTVSRIDPETNLEVEAIAVGDGPSAIAFTEGAVWVANESDGTLSRIDPGSKTVRTVRIGSIPSGLETAGGSLWVTVRGTATSHRGGTLRLVSETAPFATLDPAVSYANPWGVMIIIGDGLVGFKRVGGVEGGTLVSDLAVSLPTPTDEGRTYAFELRSGIAYSNGEIVVASDFVRGIERGFRIQNRLSPTAAFFGGLVGGRACSKTPESCDLSKGIVSDDQSGTVTFHLVEPDPEFLYKLTLPSAFPVPPSTPDEEQVHEGVPGTGPYMLEGPLTDDGLILVRNEHFRQWSVAAQPDGNVDRIEWTFGGTSEEHVEAVVSGDADYLFDDPPPSRIEDLRVRFAGQVYEHPALLTRFLFLNTSLPPFNDVGVRRALNFAVDRQRIVEFYGGPAAASLTCQFLPPNFPGYEPYCPYTIDPGPGGQWTGPDFEAAQRLVLESGTAGTHVTFWYSPALHESAKAEAQYFVQLLEELGFVTELRSTADTADGRLHGLAAIDAHFIAVYDSGRGIQIGWGAWAADYPAASNFITTMLTCDSFYPEDPFHNANAAAFCDPEIDAMIEVAVEIQTETPAASGEAWAEVDRAITDQAPFVSLVNPIDVDFVSERLGNYQYNPEWGLLLAQVWVR
jgi:YVTN family beta-propeller protein